MIYDMTYARRLRRDTGMRVLLVERHNKAKGKSEETHSHHVSSEAAANRWHICELLHHGFGWAIADWIQVGKIDFENSVTRVQNWTHCNTSRETLPPP